MQMRRWKPSIFMPRRLSRISLEVIEVRVQRVQDITEEDAEAEGISLSPMVLFPNVNRRDKMIDQFSRLWDSINAKRGFSWQSNPWVWAYTFKRIKP